jgi:predicted MFS family arabinose efflux permease
MSISIYLDSSILLIFAAFISIGPLSSVQYITDTVMITDTTPEKERINAYSIIRITSNIGFSIGPALGGIVVIFNYAYVALIPAIGAIAELFLYLRLVTETLPEKKVEKNKRANLSFPYEDRLFILIAFLLAMSWFATSPWQYITNQFFSKAYTLSGWEIGMLFSVNGLTVISLQLPINTLLKRISDMNRMSLGLVVYASTFFVIGLTRNLYLLVIDVIFLTCGENIISPPTSNIIAKIAPPNRRGVYFGSFSMINGIVSPFSPVFYEYLLSLLISEPIMLWGIVSIICVVLSVTLFLFQRAKKV